MSTNNIKDVVAKAKDIIKKRDEQIVKLKKEVSTLKGEKHVTFKMPDNVHIDNFPEVSKVRVEGPVEVKNIHVKVEDIKFPKVQDVRVVNAEGEKMAGWLPQIIVQAVKSLSNLQVKLHREGLTVKLDDTERLKPLPVIVVDTRGRPVNMNANANATVFPMVMNSHGGGSQNILEAYQITDQDDGGNTKYYGFMDKDGNWYILKNDTVASTYRYTRGTSSYAANWTNRATLTYGYFGDVF